MKMMEMYYVGVPKDQMPAIIKEMGEKYKGDFQRWGNNVPVSISFGALADSNAHRREIVSRLVENGVETRIFSAGNLGLHPFWTDLYPPFEDEVSNRIHTCGFFLPNYPELTIEGVVKICKIVRGIHD